MIINNLGDGIKTIWFENMEDRIKNSIIGDVYEQDGYCYKVIEMSSTDVKVKQLFDSKDEFWLHAETKGATKEEIDSMFYVINSGVTNESEETFLRLSKLL